MFDDAFLQTYSHIRSGKFLSDGLAKFGLLYFAYMPLPYLQQQLTEIQENQLEELPDFIYGESPEQASRPETKAKLEELKTAINNAARDRVLATYSDPCGAGYPSGIPPIEVSGDKDMFISRGGGFRESMTSWSSQGLESTASMEVASPSEIVIQRGSIDSWEESGIA